MTQRHCSPDPVNLAREAPRPAGASLSSTLKHSTREAHRRAETSGVIRRMLARRVERADYILYLRNLHPVYRALERRLAALPAHADFGPATTPGLYRRGAIERDLASLAGARWRRQVPALPAALAYVKRIQSADPARLAAHAYVRYLGDLNGGFVIRRLLRESLGLTDAELSFYDFDAIEDPVGFCNNFRAWLDTLALRLNARDVIDEALVAFQLTTDLSIAIDGCPA